MDLNRWKKSPAHFIHLAILNQYLVAGESKIQGVIMVTIREELLSHRPSAHLETIIVSPAARGQGLGRRLLQRAERRAAELGAQSLSLHVFSANRRARSLYRSHGFDEELLRCIKWFDADP